MTRAIASSQVDSLLCTRAEATCQSSIDIAGAARIALDFVTPFSRRARSHWGIDPAETTRSFPGDERVPAPRWGWTHAVVIDAPAGSRWIDACCSA